ncbi:1,4-dihydroxy-2-naphthoate octaprenyltransferase [Maribacter chungangensis]|uniref:1,4-dihydroxy-2-naphthoate octaprenyltransferase n=1 Tax=Maribacter chungangensis TaxID=1069117 RepID=A0ABW3B2E9_9FLAO
MTAFKVWLNAARPRTLPLSVSGILVGTAMASMYGQINNTIFFIAILTTIGFQVTSNFANDYGDGVKGTDNDNRIGPKRVLQSGLLTRKALKNGIMVSVAINLILVLCLLYVSFGHDNVYWGILFLFLGGFSIWAAIKYTVGDSAYGYRGLGDIFVFVFFGLVGVLGSMFLYIKTIPLVALLPAISIGLLSVGVLNLNNLRDVESDRLAGKNTVVVKMGFAKGKLYHTLLLMLSFVCTGVFIVFTFDKYVQFICLVAYVPIFIHLRFVSKTGSPQLLDPELKKLALSTFLLAILFYFSYIYFL